MQATSAGTENTKGVRWRSWLVRGALTVALIVIIGFGWSTVSKAGP